MGSSRISLLMAVKLNIGNAGCKLKYIFSIFTTFVTEWHLIKSSYNSAGDKEKLFKICS